MLKHDFEDPHGVQKITLPCREAGLAAVREVFRSLSVVDDDAWVNPDAAEAVQRYCDEGEWPEVPSPTYQIKNGRVVWFSESGVAVSLSDDGVEVDFGRRSLVAAIKLIAAYKKAGGEADSLLRLLWGAVDTEIVRLVERLEWLCRAYRCAREAIGTEPFLMNARLYLRSADFSV